MRDSRLATRDCFVKCRKKWRVFSNSRREFRLLYAQATTMKTSAILNTSNIRGAALPIRNGAIHDSLQVRSILVPTDFSASSLTAIECALPLLKSLKAELHLVHVSERDYPLADMAAIPLILPESAITPRVRRHLHRVANKYSLHLTRENIHALHGRPFEEICHLARERAVDLIIMSSRGNTGLKRLALGSTAEHVVRYSPCPVLVIHPTEEQSPNRGTKIVGKNRLNFSRIIVPIDFSGCSLKGLAYAKTLAKRFRSKLILLNSVALQYYMTSDEFGRYDLPLLMARTKKSARDQMADLIAKTDWEGIAIDTSFEIGHAGQQICEGAKENCADLIVISTHGRTGLEHVFLGSTAEYVVRHSNCSVLVVPTKERAPVK